MADAPVMSASAIEATVKQQARLRAKATGAWVVMTLALSFAGGTPLSVPAGVLWLVLSVAIIAHVTRTNRAVDASMKSTRFVAANGQTTSAFRAGRMRGAHQSLTIVAALVTYGIVGRSLTAITATDFDDPSRPMLLNLLPFLIAIAATVGAYRLVKAKLLEHAQG